MASNQPVIHLEEGTLKEIAEFACQNLYSIEEAENMIDREFSSSYTPSQCSEIKRLIREHWDEFNPEEQ